MNIGDFFESDAVRLPRERTENDFEKYLLQVLSGYRNAVTSIDSSSHLGSQINANLQQIDNLGGQVRGAVRRYLLGQPEKAYSSMTKGIQQVHQLGNLVSMPLPIAYWEEIVRDWGDCRRLYRMTVVAPREKLSKGRLFHVPYHLRHVVGQHRYGIAGFPCLYLGGSLRICQMETGVPDHELSRVAIAEFKPTRQIQVLDFGYRPKLLADLARARDAKPGSNPQLEQFIVNYATCWPMIAACSIKRMHDAPFVAEYIVPQILTQWLMRDTTCDGIRFFSTRMDPPYDDIHQVANYIFPARTLQGVTKGGFSKWLINRFEMTEPCRWKGMTLLRQIAIRLFPRLQRRILPKQFALNRDHLKSLPKSRL